eukprot:g613.t1
MRRDGTKSKRSMKKEKDLRLLKMRVVTFEEDKKRVVGGRLEQQKTRRKTSARSRRMKNTDKRASQKTFREKRRADVRDREKRELKFVDDLDVSETRHAIRDLIRNLEKTKTRPDDDDDDDAKGELKEEKSKAIVVPEHVASNIESTKSNSERAVDPARVLQDYAALQRQEAKRALQMYELELKESMEAELERHRETDLARRLEEREMMESQFRKDEEAVTRFDAAVVAKIRELEGMREQARQKLGELRECRKHCVHASQDSHRMLMEETMARLQADMNQKVRKRHEALQRRLASVLAPSSW